MRLGAGGLHFELNHIYFGMESTVARLYKPGSPLKDCDVSRCTNLRLCRRLRLPLAHTECQRL
jgi:hypothetical protein